MLDYGISARGEIGTLCPTEPLNSLPSIAITTEGKQEAIKEGATEALMDLLKDEMADVRLNAIKVQTLSPVRLNTIKVNYVSNLLSSALCVTLRVLNSKTARSNYLYTAFKATIHCSKQLKVE